MITSSVPHGFFKKYNSCFIFIYYNTEHLKTWNFKGFSLRTLVTSRRLLTIFNHWIVLQKLLQGIILLPLLLDVFSFLFFFFWWQHHTIYRLLFATKSEHSSTSLPSPCLISSQHRLNYRMLLSYSNCFQKQRFPVIQPKQLPL